MSIAAIAGLIAAIAFAILAGFMIYPLIRLGRLFDSIAHTIKDAGDHLTPTLDETKQTIQNLNKTLEDVSTITDSTQSTVRNVGALVNLYTAILGKPIIAVASFFWSARQTMEGFMHPHKDGKDDKKAKKSQDKASLDTPTSGSSQSSNT